MRRASFVAALAAFVIAIPAAAQGQAPRGGPDGGPPPPDMQGPPPPERMGPPPSAADWVLGHTGELKLTDAQVVRLAAVARRAADRHDQMRAQFEARRGQMTPGQPPSAADRQRMQQAFEQEREQGRADLRDALSVLTPDQQARAWEMMARGHGGPRGEMGPGRGPRGMGPRGGPDGRDGPDGRGGPGMRGPDGRQPPPPPAQPQG
jgi:hypothetical protein